MKQRYLLLTVVFFHIAICSFSQQEMKIEQFKCSRLIPVYTPVLIDSVDINNKKFEKKDLLQSQINFDEVFTSKERLNADTSGIVSLPFAPWDAQKPDQDKALQLLSFNIDADRYCKAKLTISCTDMLEVYINDKKEKSKETQEDSLSKAQNIEIDLALEPTRHEIVIKRLVAVKNFNESAIKVTLAPAKKDSLSRLTVSLDAPRRIKINDIIEGNRLSGSNLSPGGKYCIVSFYNTLLGGNGSGVTELREVKTNKILYRFPSSVRPSWIPNSELIVYSRDGVKDKDLIQFDPATLEETTLAEGIRFDSYSFSPDSRFLIIGIREEIPADKGDLKRLLSPSDRAGSYRGRYSLYLYTFNDKSLQRLTFGKTNTYLSDISNDSKKALFTTYQEDITERPFSKKILYEMDLQTLKIDTLIQDRFISSASYSPDDQQLLITGGPEAFEGIGENIKPGQISNTYDNQAFIWDKKSRKAKAITTNFNPSISGSKWSTWDQKIYFTTEDKDRVQIYSYDIKSDQFSKLNLPEDMIAGFQVAEKSPVALFRGESVSNAYRLYSYDLKSGKSTLLADPFKSQLDKLGLGPVKDWDFTSSDGSTIYGRYYLPYNFDPDKKYPMIVYYYGGTSPTTRVFESTYPLHTYAAMGYVVYTLQPSGTTGFGQEFAARHVNAWGKVTADEIIEGTKKFCAEHAFVDSKKIGCIGASYGGFMTQYLQTQTNIFAAAISHAGISSIASYWGEGYWGYAYSGAASAGSFPWNNPRLYVEQSPLFHADKINTPLLLLHGNVDTNVPLGESIQMYNALKILGKTVEFIQVEGENHAIYGYKKRIEWNKTIHAWFAKWLKDQPEWWETLYPKKD